jgi:chromosome segregation ATPase
MFVLGISDSATFAMWAITLTVNGGMGIILYRVAAWQRRFDRQEDTHRTDQTNLRQKIDEMAKEQHQTTEKLIDERFRKVTHQVDNHALAVSGALSELKDQIKESKSDLDGLGDRDQRIELTVAQKVDQVKDYIRENVPLKEDLEKHEQTVSRRFGQIEDRVIRMGEDVAVLKSAAGVKRGA